MPSIAFTISFLKIIWLFFKWGSYRFSQLSYNPRSHSCMATTSLVPIAVYISLGLFPASSSGAPPCTYLYRNLSAISSSSQCHKVLLQPFTTNPQPPHPDSSESPTDFLTSLLTCSLIIYRYVEQHRLRRDTADDFPPWSCFCIHFSFPEGWHLS